MATKKAMLEYLRRVPMFSPCTAKDLEKILKAGDEISTTVGQVIIDQGQISREAFVLLSGSATVRRNGKKVATLGTGAIVGELSLFDHGPRTATVTCEEDCHLLVIPQREFIAVLEQVPGLNRRMLEFLAGRIRESDRRYFG